MKTYGGRYLEAEELAALGCRDVGRDVRVHSTCLLVGLENLSFGSHIRVDAFSSLIAGDGQIRVGDHNHIAAYAFLSGAEGIELGDVVGAGSIVLPGCNIAEGTTVGALSLVKSSLAPWGIYAGVPVRRLRDRSRALLELERRLSEEG